MLAEQKSFPHSKGDGRYGGSGLDERREQAIDVVGVQLYRKREEKLKAKIFSTLQGRDPRDTRPPVHADAPASG